MQPVLCVAISLSVSNNKSVLSVSRVSSYGRELSEYLWFYCYTISTLLTSIHDVLKQFEERSFLKPKVGINYAPVLLLLFTVLSTTLLYLLYLLLC